IRFSYEDPQAHIDQDWAVVYAGALPGFFDSRGNPRVIANVASTDGYRTLAFSAATAQFCSAGIEDFALGQQRAQAQLAAMRAAGIASSPERLDHRIADYVQMTDGLLPDTDKYWGLDNDCWEGLASDPGARRQLCSSTYGETFDPSNQTNYQRDFPILEAYDGKLV